MSYHEYKHEISISNMPPGWTTEYIEHRGYDSPDREIVATHPKYGRVFVGVGKRIDDGDRSAIRAKAWQCHPEIKTICLDLDDVYVDWKGAVIKLLGYDLEEIRRRWNSLDPRPWCLFEIIDHSLEDGWAEINKAGSDFWANLETLPWANDLLEMCKSCAPTIFLTSPSLHHSSHAGKIQWMQSVFGKDFRDYLLGSVKHCCAHPGALLIDDSPKNCKAFIEHGGHAILFPDLANDLYHIEDKLSYVQEQLKSYRFVNSK